jgi:cysteine desulfurase
MQKKVYLDNAATTMVCEEALEAMVEAYRRGLGNSSSVHAFGQEARNLLEDCRERFAACIGARPGEIIFTGGGTESDNLALRGIALARRKEGNHIITSAVEHHAVLHCCEALEKEGFRVTYLPVDGDGVVDLDALERALDDETILVSVMLANNETGTLQPLEKIVETASGRGVPVHTDAVQAVGKIPLDVRELGVDLLSVSGHKFHGPKGVGALYVREGLEIMPIMQGGHHEKGLRPGTVNYPAVAGMTRALELALREREEAVSRWISLKRTLVEVMEERIEGVVVNGDVGKTLPNILNVGFPGADGESLLLALDMRGIAVSTGSACTSGAPEPSHVLLAMGVRPEVARCSLRFSMGWTTTGEEVEYVLDVLPGVVRRIREVSPLGAGLEGSR